MVIYLENESLDPYFNLAMEEYIYEQMDRSQEYFRLWQNDNAVVVGKYQNVAEEINLKYIEENQVHVVRRFSGGGTVFHDRGNLNFSFMVDKDKTGDFDMKLFLQPVLDAITALGAPAEMNDRNDIIIGGKKCSGSAQFTSKNRFLYHGCIMLSSDLTNISGALKKRDATVVSKSVKSVRSPVTTVNEHLEKPVTIAEFKEEILKQVFQNNNIRKHIWTEKELETVAKLREDKYATWEWNYGYRATYDYERTMTFADVTLSVKMKVKNARIEEIHFAGNYEEIANVRELEEKMKGVLLDPSFRKTVERLSPDDYMKGITADHLCQMILY